MRILSIALLSSVAIGAGLVASTMTAAAFWPLLIQVLLGATAGGVVAGSAIAAVYPPPSRRVTTATGPDSFPPPSWAFGPPTPAAGAEPLAPASGCAFSRRSVNGVWRRVEICD